MFLSDFSIKRPVTTVAIVVMLMCLGLLALNKLRVNQIPDVQQPVIVIDVPYPGASPETVEREVIDRLEKALQSIPEVYQIKSTASESNASIVMIFDFKKNMLEAPDEIRNAIASVRHKLPTEMREPILQRFDPSSEPIMWLALSATQQSHAEISRLAEDELADKFRAIDGVAVVNVYGSVHRELSVLLRAEKMREYNMSVADVVNALRLQNTTAPVGRVEGPLEEQSIRLVGRIESPAEFEQIVLKRRGDEIVRLGQVAVVEDGFAELTGFSIRNGRPNVGLSVTRSRDASTVTVANEVRKVVEETNKTLPPGTRAGSDERRRQGCSEQPVERHRSLDVRCGADDLRRLRFPQFVAIDSDHGIEPAHFGDRGIHRGMGVRVHAQLHDAAWAFARHRRAHRRCHRGA